MAKKIFKVIVILCTARLIPVQIWEILFAYTIVALFLQTILNGKVERAPKLKNFLLTIRLAKLTENNRIVLRTPLPFAKKLIGWVLSEHLINTKSSRWFERFGAECKAAYDGGDAKEDEE